MTDIIEFAALRRFAVEVARAKERAVPGSSAATREPLLVAAESAS